MVEIYDFDTLHELAQTILTEAKKQGVDHAQVEVFSNENIATRFGENHITQNTQSNSLQFDLQTQLGEKIGSYQGTASSHEILPKLVGQALELTKMSPPDPDFPGFVQEQPEYAEFERPIINYDAMDIAEVIQNGIDIALQSHNKVKTAAGSINYNADRQVLANTHGLEAETDQSTISGVMNIAAREGDSESRSSDSIAGLTIDDLAIDKVAETVAERAVRGLNQGELDIGSYETVFSNGAILEMMIYVNFATSSSMLINHQSPFKDKMGEQLFDQRLTIEDATEDTTHYSSQKYDTDGIPSKSLNYIENGIVKDFAYNRRNAKKLGVETNGRAINGFALFRAPHILPGAKSEEDLIASIDDGVYVSNLWYVNFTNMSEASLTGLTKDGLFKIEDGEIVGSVKNMRFTDTLYSMFEEIEPANNLLMKLHGSYGNYYGFAGKIPSVRLGKFNFSSKGKH